ncbi:hypothetical protein Egran_07149 [Elaphomyces granulatus]|uniref:Lipoyl-binding domain-containing protein n=1 Tax=Elaphomyces granulatus TaxID=519963 RepID=A0A232LLP9_9EURO|nr:hypothetical protein Egran_07149 [Elaphomyces granulatus]
MDYDPLLAKLAVWGASREAAIRRLDRALSECSVFGIKTNIGFFRAILQDSAFADVDEIAALAAAWHSRNLAPSSAAPPQNGNGAAAHWSASEVEPGVYSILRNGQSYLARVAKVRDTYHVEVNGHSATVGLRDPRALTRSSSKGAHGGRQSIAAPMPGKIVRVLVTVGDTVEAGQGLVVVEAMKMQNEMKAPRAGTIVEVKATSGATVTAGDILIVLE